MPILKDILQDSWGHYRNLERKLRARLKKLPNGSVFKRRIGKQHYYYLSYRKEGAVLSKYLGKECPDNIEEGIEERRLLKRQLQEVKKNLRILSKTRKPASRV